MCLFSEKAAVSDSLAPLATPETTENFADVEDGQLRKVQVPFFNF